MSWWDYLFPQRQGSEELTSSSSSSSSSPAPSDGSPVQETASSVLGQATGEAASSSGLSGRASPSSSPIVVRSESPSGPLVVLREQRSQTPKGAHLLEEVVEEVRQAFPGTSSELSTQTSGKFTDYSSTKIDVAAQIPTATRETWRYQRLDCSWVDLHTRPMPDELLEHYHIESGEFELISEGGAGTQREKCAQQIEQMLADLCEDPSKAHLFNEPHFSRMLSNILDTLWSKSTVEWAISRTQQELADTGEEEGVRLTTRPVGLIEVDIEIPDGSKIELRCHIRMQLEAVRMNDEGVETRSLPFFSTTKVVTVVPLESELSEPDEVENVSISFGEFQHVPRVEEKVSTPTSGASPGYLAGVGRAVGNMLAFKDHSLKRGKYQLSLSQAAQALGIADHVYENPEEYVADRNRAVVDVHSGVVKMRAILSSQMDLRTQYREFLDTLRRTIQTADYQTMMANMRQNPDNYPEELRLIHQLVKARFCGNEMYDYCHRLVSSCMDLAPDEMLHELDWDEQFARIDEMPDELGANRLAVSYAKLKGFANVGFDPHRETNVPYVNYRFMFGGMERTNLRFGTPTWEGVWHRASVVPEFTALLDAIAVEGGKHLYINLQDRNPRYIGDESGRSNALEALATTYPDTLYIATLSQDSDFYNQSKGFAALNNAEKFKEEFMLQMLERPNSGFFFSENLHIQDNVHHLVNILQEVHERMFDGRETLTVRERQDFIEIAYTLMTLRLLQISGAETFNMSCKDAIDRGGKNMALLLAALGMMTDKMDDPEFKEQHMVSTHAPALIVKKQAIIPSRRIRFTQAIETLSAHKDAVRSLNSGYGVSNPEIRRGAEQTQPLTSSSSEDETSSPEVEEQVWTGRPLPPPPKMAWSSDADEKEEWSDEEEISSQIEERVWTAHPLPTQPKMAQSSDVEGKEEWSDEEDVTAEPVESVTSSSSGPSQPLNVDLVNALKNRFLIVCNRRNPKTVFSTGELTPARDAEGEVIPGRYVVDEAFIRQLGEEVFKAKFQLGRAMQGVSRARRSRMAPGVSDVFQALLDRVRDPSQPSIIFSTDDLTPAKNKEGQVVGLVVDEKLIRQMGEEVLNASFDTAYAFHQAQEILNMGSRGSSQFKRAA